MPESPEILSYVTFLQKYLDSTILTNILHNNKQMNLHDNYKGKIININCKGKLMWLSVSTDTKNIFYYIHIHLGLKGKILTSDIDHNNIRYEFIFSNDKKIYIDDSINLASVKILDESEHSNALNKLGIDVFSQEFTLNNFALKFKKKKGMLAGFIMDQKNFAGMGNYIKNEILYLSNLNVKIKTNELTDEDIKNLYNNILYVAYSKLLTNLKQINLYVEDVDKNKLVNMPKNITLPYVFKVYKQKTVEGKKNSEPVIKTKILNRDSYTITELL